MSIESDTQRVVAFSEALTAAITVLGDLHAATATGLVNIDALPTTGHEAGGRPGLFSGPKGDASSSDDERLQREQKLQDAIDKSKAKILAEENAAKAVSEEVQHTADLADAAKTKLDEMSAAAGVNDKSGAGAKVKQLTDDLDEARERLQNLQDTGAAQSTVDEQQKAVDDLAAKLNDAEKQLRITTYEFKHSDAYKRQVEQIAQAQADADTAKKAAEDEQKKLEGMRADEQKLEDDLSASQASAVDALTEEGANVVDVNKQLLRDSQIRTAGLYAAAKQVQRATKELRDAATGIAQDAADQAATQVLSPFEKQLQQIADFGGYQFGDSQNGLESGVFNGPELLHQLEYLVRHEHDPKMVQMWAEMQRDIQQIVALIRKVAGKAGSNFSLEQFKAWVATHKPTSSSGSGSSSSSVLDSLLSTGQI